MFSEEDKIEKIFDQALDYYSQDEEISPCLDSIKDLALKEFYNTCRKVDVTDSRFEKEAFIIAKHILINLALQFQKSLNTEYKPIQPLLSHMMKKGELNQEAVSFFGYKMKDAIRLRKAYKRGNKFFKWASLDGDQEIVTS